MNLYEVVLLVYAIAVAAGISFRMAYPLVRADESPLAFISIVTAMALSAMVLLSISVVK